MRFREQARPGTSTVFGAGWIPDKMGMCSDRDWRAYALVYITVGGGSYEDADGRSTALVPGDLLVLFPGLRHTYGPGRAGGWTEVWLGFRGPVFAALEADGILDRQRPVLHPGLDEGLIARFDALVAAVDRAGGTGDAVLVARLHQLIADLTTNERAPAPSSLAARARAELESDLRHPIDLPQLAGRLGVGYDTLRRAFHAEHGTTPGRWRLLRRIERAKQLLAEGMTLDATAAETGFCDRFFLARQFRNVVGMPPGRWRSELLGSPLSSDVRADPAGAGRSRAADHPDAAGHSGAAGRHPGRDHDPGAPARRGRDGATGGRARP
jgi:AraC-like DNA-binding protein